MKKLFLFCAAVLASVSMWAVEIFSTDVLAEISSATVTSGNGDFTTGGSLSWSGEYKNYFLTSGSAGYYQISFTTPISFTDYSDVKLKVYWGAGSNRPLNLSINGGSATKIDEVSASGDRSKLREIESAIDVSSLSTIKFSSSGGGNVYLFRIEISGISLKYTVTYSKGAYGTGDAIVDGIKTKDVAFTLSSETYFRSGYIQEGWATIDGGEKVYNLGGSYTENADITLYPYWEAISAPTHAVEYTNLKGQSIEGYPTEYYEGYGIPSFEPLEDVDGWHFAGWSPASISDTDDEDMVITAVWKEIFTVSFNTVGGSEIDPINVVDGETAIAPTAPTRLNWTFQKWQLNGDDYDFSAAVTEDITLDAVWKRDSVSGPSSDVTIIDGTTMNQGGTLSVVHYYQTKASNNHFKYDGTMKGSGSRVTKFTVPENKSAVVKSATIHSTSIFVIINSSAVSGDYTTANTATFDFGNPFFSLTGTGSTESSATINKTMPAGDYFCGSTASGLEVSKFIITVTTAPLYVKFIVNGVKTDSITTSTGEKLGNFFLDGELPEPVVAGYTFNGWKNAANNVAVDKNTAVGEVSMIVYADMTKDSGTALDNTDASVKAVKFFKDGQIFIEKNGHVYNVLGACIK